MPPSEHEISKRLADLFRQDLNEVAGQLPPQGSQVINRQTTRFRQTKGVKKKVYPLKMMIGERTAEGNIRYYVGGDRPKPTFIYETPDIPSFNTGFVNTGKGLNDWIATFVVGIADTPETNQFVHVDGKSGEIKTFSASYVTWLQWHGRDFWTTPNIQYCRTYHEDFYSPRRFHHQTILSLTQSVSYKGNTRAFFKLYESGFEQTSLIPIPPWMTWGQSYPNDGSGQIIHYGDENPDEPNELSDIGVSQTISINYAQYGVSNGEPLPELPQTFVQNFTLHGSDSFQTDETQSWSASTNAYVTPQTTSAASVSYDPFRTSELEEFDEDQDGVIIVRWTGNPCAIPARSPRLINLEQTYAFIWDFVPSDRLTNMVSLKLWNAASRTALPLTGDVFIADSVGFVGDTLYTFDYADLGDKTQNRLLPLQKIKLNIDSEVTPKDPFRFSVPVYGIPQTTGIFWLSYFPG